MDNEAANKKQYKEDLRAYLATVSRSYDQSDPPIHPPGWGRTPELDSDEDVPVTTPSNKKVSKPIIKHHNDSKKSRVVTTLPLSSAHKPNARRTPLDDVPASSYHS